MVHRMLNTDHMQLLKSITIHYFVPKNSVELLLLPLKNLCVYHIVRKWYVWCSIQWHDVHTDFTSIG